MDSARRQGRLAFGLALAGWGLIIASLTVGFMHPRWYLWDDWREVFIRVAFWVVLFLVPATAIAALFILRRARGALASEDGPWARWASVVGVCVLVLCGLATLSLLVFLMVAGSA